VIQLMFKWVGNLLSPHRSEMGRRPKLSPEEILRRSTGSGPKTITQKFLSGRVLASTQAQYRSRVRQLTSYMELCSERDGSKNRTVLTKAVFLRFLEGIYGAYDAQAAEAYRDAVLFHHKSTGKWKRVARFAASKTCRQICQGFAYMTRRVPIRGKKTRGSLSWEMVQQLVKLARQGSTMGLLPGAIKLHFGAALRVYQLFSITSGDWDASTNKLRVPDKRANAANGRPTYTWKKVVNCDAMKILKDRCRKVKKGKPLFPKDELPRHRYTQFISAAGEALGFSDNVLRMTSHSLRHGGIRSLSRKLRGRDDKQDILQVSQRMEDHYSKSNRARRTQATRKKEG